MGADAGQLKHRLRPARPGPARPGYAAAVRLEAETLTVSDSVHAGAAAYRSGPALGDQLDAAGFTVVARRPGPDGVDHSILCTALRPHQDRPLVVLRYFRDDPGAPGPVPLAVGR